MFVAVSGGKDSLSMLKLLNERKMWAPVDYRLIAIHIESDYKCGGAGYRKRLKKFFIAQGVEHHFEKIKIVNKKKDVSCFWCSWNRNPTLPCGK